MRRFLLTLLMFLLPFQFAWSATAAYCQHESSAAVEAQHFGHHEHSHKETGKTSGNKLAVDSDCGFCHGGGLPVLMQATSMQVTTSVDPSVLTADLAPPPSAPSRAPDRPQWLRLS